jgi:hypothetical protein
LKACPIVFCENAGDRNVIIRAAADKSVASENLKPNLHMTSSFLFVVVRAAILRSWFVQNRA